MKSSLLTPTAPGRPPEIEEPINRWLVHPAARALVDRLVRTPITPNQVSIASVFAAAAAAAAFTGLANPLGPLIGLAFLFVWHVLDGADGELARRTGRASPLGELVDGVCDHLSQALIYVALAVILQRTLGAWAWGIAASAAVCHTIQANAYETGRKSYRHWVYGAPWMRQARDGSRTWARVVSRAYLSISSGLNPEDGALDAAMSRAASKGEPAARRARALYQARMVQLVKRSGLLGATGRSVAVVACLLVGRPGWFFLWEIVGLNTVLAVTAIARVRVSRAIVKALEHDRSRGSFPHAASAPN